jgi:uncharacterized membrane protein required for colicin V production
VNINVFDILIVALPVTFLLLGFLHTGWREFLSLVGVTAGAAVGAVFGGRLADVIARVLPERDLAQVIAFLVILAGGWALGGVIGGIAERLQSGSRSESNRVLPAVFGLLKGGVLDLSLVWIVDRYIPAFQGPLRNATLSAYVNEVISYLTHHNPL